MSALPVATRYPSLPNPRRYPVAVATQPLSLPNPRRYARPDEALIPKLQAEHGKNKTAMQNLEDTRTRLRSELAEADAQITKLQQQMFKAQQDLSRAKVRAAQRRSVAEGQ